MITVLQDRFTQRTNISVTSTYKTKRPGVIPGFFCENELSVGDGPPYAKIAGVNQMLYI